MHYSANIILYSYSGVQNKHFEYLINIRGPTKVEKHKKMLGSSDFFGSVKVKKHKSLGRDLKI